jgi:hypothetical protein
MFGLRASILPALSLAAVVACSAGSSKGPPLVVCTPGQDGCPQENSALSHGKNPADSETPSDPVPTPGQTPKASPTPKSTPAPDPGDAGGGGSSGGSADGCGMLASCCAAIRSAGITGTADNCDAVVANADPIACDSELAADAIPDDFYDPPAACLVTP